MRYISVGLKCGSSFVIAEEEIDKIHVACSEKSDGLLRLKFGFSPTEYLYLKESDISWFSISTEDTRNAHRKFTKEIEDEEPSF